jgi:myo-inositol-1(or 4)-monophosphatase
MGHFGVSIGLTYQKKLLLGVVCNPLTDDITSAQAGKGAFFNEKNITVSSQDTLKKSVVLLGRGNSAEENDRFASVYSSLIPHIRTFRAYGSIALDGSAVARGNFDAIVMNGAHFYDCAAIALIAQEAGAKVVDFKGAPWDVNNKRSDIVIANSPLAASLVDKLSSL